jgi:citronellol/citronellal dehydrogenase
VGWGAIAAPAEVRNREAIKPFDGFHLATIPKVFQK